MVFYRQVEGFEFNEFCTTIQNWCEEIEAIQGKTYVNSSALIMEFGSDKGCFRLKLQDTS